MSEVHTTIIVGAGASAEFKLPIGSELKRIIAEKLDFRFDLGTITSGDRIIAQAIRTLISEDSNIQSANSRYWSCAQHIHDAMPQTLSIDSFINSQKIFEIEKIGKLAIVQSILEAERNSKLWFSPVDGSNCFDFKSVEVTWLNKLFYKLSDGLSLIDFAKKISKINFIIFNYDRCIEHFLFCSVKNYYRVSDDAAAKALSNIKIYHPYGVTGCLPWQGGESCSFGLDANAAKLREISSQIRTFSESFVDEPTILEDLREKIRVSREVIFLGYAFHEQNNKIFYSLNNNNIESVFGTVFGFSENDALEIKSSIFESFGKVSDDYIKLQGLTCGPFLDYYGRSIKLK